MCCHRLAVTAAGNNGLSSSTLVDGRYTYQEVCLVVVLVFICSVIAHTNDLCYRSVFDICMSSFMSCNKLTLHRKQSNSEEHTFNTGRLTLFST